MAFVESAGLQEVTKPASSLEVLSSNNGLVLWPHAVSMPLSKILAVAYSPQKTF